MARYRGRVRVVEPHIKPPAVFYGYVLGYYLNIRWTLAPTGGMGNPELYNLVRKYLIYTCGENEWVKRQVLDVIRDRGRNAIRDVAESEFPSLFSKGGRQRPLQIPEELKGQEIKFDLDFVNKLKDEVAIIKKEIAMSTEGQTDNEMEEGVDAESNAPKKSTTIVVPEGVDVNSLTIDNFRQLTGKRFRMTKEQRAREQAGQLTREQALEEFKVNILGGGSNEASTNE